MYDADGNRIIRTEPNGTTIYVGGQEIHINTDGDVSATRYYSFAGKLVAIRTDRGLGDGVTSIITEHHGTPIAAIPNGGHPHTTPINRLYTDPFGATRGDFSADTISGDIQFLGKTRDATTGLTQIGARYYDEGLGRFISVDPILDLGDPQQWNAYAYAGNDPVTRSDPSGLLALGATDYVDVKGKSFSSKANGTVHASPPKTVDVPVTSAFAAVGALSVLDWGAVLSTTGGAMAVGLEAVTWAAVGAVGSAGASLLGVLSMSGDSSNARAEAETQSATEPAVISTPASPDPDCGPDTFISTPDQEDQQAIASEQTGVGEQTVRFGNDANQRYHAFRHVVDEGFSPTAVSHAIRSDLQSVGNSIGVNQQYSGSVIVNSVRFEYSAFRLPSGVLNVGRITLGR